MGYTKRHTEYASSSGTDRRKRSTRTNYKPGKYAPGNHEELSFRDLVDQFRMQWQRWRAALRFRIVAWFNATFSRGNLLKVGILVGLVYWCFGDQTGGFTVFSREEVVRPVTLNYDMAEESGAAPVEENEFLKPPTRRFAKPRTETAPISADDIANPEVRVYVKRYYQTAIDEMRRYGIPASISLGQGIIESRAGTSKLAKLNNNHFGIKCFSKKCRKGHCSNHFDDHHKDFFRIFKSPWESWRAHSVMISSGRYASLKKNGIDYRKWAVGLKKKGYATDAHYDQKLIDMIERYKLYRYDK